MLDRGRNAVREAQGAWPEGLVWDRSSREKAAGEPLGGLDRTSAGWLGTEDIELASIVALGFGVWRMKLMLLDAVGTVLFASPDARALLDDRRAMWLDPEGRLRLGDGSAQSELRRFLRERASSAGLPEFATFAIPRQWGWPLVARLGVCDPGLMRDAKRPGTGEGHTFLLVRDPDTDLHGHVEGIASIFGLSRAEAEVALGLAAGASLIDIAERRGVALTTIRNQVKAAQSKLGVSRQAELVSVVLKAAML